VARACAVARDSPGLSVCPSALTDAVPTSCCLSYHQRPIPRGLISSLYFTSSSCSQPGVIVVTKKKKQVCVDPRESWVQERLKHFQTPQN
ncbi:CCL3 protein, partial [Formicarius rufipectus]|nr:CCL3 protein [Formicarius rufipectus]